MSEPELRGSNSDSTTPEMSNAELQAEIVRLNKMVQALMNRAERSSNVQGSAFSLFQTALVLEQQVRHRTQELEAALFENERIRRALQKSGIEMGLEIAQRKKMELLREAQFRILEMIASNAAINDVLIALTSLIDLQQSGTATSILLLDDSGEMVCDVIAPHLPSTLNQSLYGLRIGPDAGSCGAAMYRRETVIVSDIASDPLWDSCRDAVMPFRLRACWSTPILTHDGRVLGSLATYHQHVHEPDGQELRLAASAAHLAGMAIERHQIEARIRHMAHHDALTDLPNRILMEDRIAQAISMAQREHSVMAVMMIDLDRFKHVNDSLGHPIGDRLLQEVAQRLQLCVRSSDSVARLGGDEFVINLQKLHSLADATLIAEKVLHTLAQLFSIEGHAILIGGSIGISLFPQDGANSADLLRAADTAMYAAKTRGRGNFQFYTAEMNNTAKEQSQLQAQLRQALVQQQFMLHYQPQICLNSGRIVAAEALLRWQHPQRGLLMPAAFLPLLEDSGMMSDVGALVLSQACQQLQQWQKQGLPAIVLAVNVSAQQFLRGDFVGTVNATLTGNRLPATQLELEFTEAAMFDGSDKMIDAMQTLKQLGISMALDDFGTGFSSLSYLQRFPVNRLKIDRSFIRDVLQHQSSTDIVRSIIGLAHNMKLSVVAEGVESPEQAQFLLQLNCEQAQGYFYSAALPPDEFAQLLRTQPFMREDKK